MKEEYIEDLISIVKEDTNPALGCTEPVAVAFTASTLRNYSKGELKELKIEVCNNIFKNGKSVMIPKTGKSGLDLAGILGFVGGNPDKGYMVLEDIKESDIERAIAYLNDKKVNLSHIDTDEDVFVRVSAFADNETVAITSNSHIGLKKIYVDGNLVYENEGKKKKKVDRSFLKELSFKEIKDLADTISLDRIMFIEDGIKMNEYASEEGLKSKDGLSIGKTLKSLMEEGSLKMDSSSKARLLTAAAADMRMGGGTCPIMTSGGSGNQGLGVIIPIKVVYDTENLEREKLIRSVFFAHLINVYVKAYSGKLSGMCGCAIGAGIGSSAGITYMLGGNLEEIEGSASNMFANLAGMLCDGAKDTCSLKLSTSAGEAVISSYLALEGVIVKPNVGIIGDSIEKTIQNIGDLSKKAFKGVDSFMLEIIDK